jgi:hypothetical protein
MSEEKQKKMRRMRKGSPTVVVNTSTSERKVKMREKKKWRSEYYELK